MSEISKYTDLKTKLEGICDENNLVATVQNRKYPFYMTIKPLNGMDAQMSMLEDDEGDAGYLSPESVLVFAYRDGDLTYKMSETINISDNLFGKLKNLFNKLHKYWMMYFFRDVTEHTETRVEEPASCDAADQTEPEDEPVEDDELAEFLETAEDAVAE